jgi:CubicO group peptidase (beta-lactamase class C family)
MKDKHPDVMQGYPPTRSSQVTYANYIQPPFNTWGFRNMDSATHSAMIARGGDLPVLEETPNTAISNHEIEDANGDKLTLSNLLEKHDADGFIMLRDGKIVYEEYWNGYSAQQRHIWFSMTKSLVSVAFGILQQQMKIDLNASPVKYILELRGSGFERTTIQDVLNHASAISFKENYIDPGSDFARFYAPALGMAFIPGAQDVQPGATEIYGVFDFLSKFVQPEKSSQPGESFEYNSANADVIGWIIARLSGLSLQEFVTKHIWSKLGTYHDAAIVVDRAYMAVATGGMTSTLRDAALFGSLILNKGQANGSQIIVESWINETLNVDESDQRRFNNNTHYQNEPWRYYKNMWWILDPEKEEYAAVGIHGQVIYINGSTNTVISQFSSQPTASQVGSIEFRSKLLAIREIANL